MHFKHKHFDNAMQSAPAGNGITIVSGPCHCAHCRGTMFSVVSELAYRELVKRSTKRQIEILPPPTVGLITGRWMKRIEAEVANYAAN